MTKTITRHAMYQDNIVAAKHVNARRRYEACGGTDGVQEYVYKDIERIRYLKICWNCGTVYESFKYNSFACKPQCRYNLIYKLKQGVRPPVRMELFMKAKNICNLKDRYGYI